jgi:hypothetical protein
MRVHYRSSTAKHEAGHVASVIMLRGRLPELVTADWPKHDTAGLTRLDFSNDGLDERPLDFVVLTLAGPLAESAPIPDWPPNAGAENTRDEHALATLVDFLGLDEDDWLNAVERTLHLVRDADFQRLVQLIARALELADELNADDLVG